MSFCDFVNAGLLGQVPNLYRSIVRSAYEVLIILCDKNGPDFSIMGILKDMYAFLLIDIPNFDAPVDRSADNIYAVICYINSRDRF